MFWWRELYLILLLWFMIVSVKIGRLDRYDFALSRASHNIQDDSWLVDVTAGGDFLGLCDQRSSCKQVSDFGRLPSYGHFLIPVHALVWTASYGTSWQVMYSTWWLFVCIASIVFATWLAHPATVRILTLGRYLRNVGKVGWVVIHLASVYWTTQQLLPVQRRLSLTLQWLCRLLMFRTVWW
jgi:hypothetical protein